MLLGVSSPGSAPPSDTPNGRGGYGAGRWGGAPGEKCKFAYQNSIFPSKIGRPDGLKRGLNWGVGKGVALFEGQSPNAPEPTKAPDRDAGVSLSR